MKKRIKWLAVAASILPCAARALPSPTPTERERAISSLQARTCSLWMLVKGLRATSH